jgi:hypothetical protein
VGNAEGQKTFVEDILALQTKLEGILKSALFNQVCVAVTMMIMSAESSGLCRKVLYLHAATLFNTICGAFHSTHIPLLALFRSLSALWLPWMLRRGSRML